MSFNKIFLLGYLGRNPEMRFTAAGKQVAQFSMATNHKYKIDGQLQSETEWFNIVTFGRVAQISCEYLKKGQPVFVEGRIHTNSWTDNTGQKHTRTEVLADNVRLIGKGDGNGNRTPSETPAEETDTEPF